MFGTNRQPSLTDHYVTFGYEVRLLGTHHGRGLLFACWEFEIDYEACELVGNTLVRKPARALCYYLLSYTPGQTLTTPTW